MRVTESLIEDGKRERREKRREEPDEEIELYMEWKRPVSLDRDPGIFHSETFGGINTEESVFNRTALFRTDR